MTRAITFGTFGLLHYGHMRFLARMREMDLESIYYSCYALKTKQKRT